VCAVRVISVQIIKSCEQNHFSVTVCISSHFISKFVNIMATDSWRLQCKEFTIR